MILDDFSRKLVTLRSKYGGFISKNGDVILLGISCKYSGEWLGFQGDLTKNVGMVGIPKTVSILKWTNHHMEYE